LGWAADAFIRTWRSRVHGCMGAMCATQVQQGGRRALFLQLWMELVLVLAVMLAAARGSRRAMMVVVI